MSTVEQHPPLPVGLTLDRGFALLRRHPRALLLPQFVLQTVPLVVGLVLVGIGVLLVGDVDTTRETVRQSTLLGDSELVTRDAPDFTGGQITVIAILGVLGAIVYLWFILASVVSVVRGADRALEGQEHLKLRPAMRDALRETPKLFGLGIVFYLLLLAVVLGITLVVVVVAALAGALAVLVGLAGLLVLVWFGVRLFLWPFVHLSEHTGIGSFRRAWTLSKGRFWSLLGILVLVAIVVFVVALVLSLVLQLLLVGAASLGDAVGVVAFIPYVVLSTLIGLVVVAGYIAPLAVAYRTLAGRDTADLWRAAREMQGDGAASPDLAAPAPEPGVRRWDASEAPIDDRPTPGADAGAAPPRGTAGLPDPGEVSDAERRWGRGGDEPPAS